MDRAEDQLSTFLAWLADHCSEFARKLARKFFSDDEEGLAALDRAKRIGAHVQVRLPSVGRGLLWADFSLDGSDREFQLLIEVKLTADFHHYEIEGVGEVRQPDAYLHAWRHCDEKGEARVRRIGTLSLAGNAPGMGDEWRAADCSWAEIADLIEDVLAKDGFTPQTAEVAHEVLAHLRERVLPPAVPAGFLEWGAKLTRGVCEGLSKHLVEPRVSGGFSPKEEAHYTGGYLEWAAPTGEREQLWFVVTPAGGDYNVPGAPPSLQIRSVYENELSADAVARLRSAGFEELKDKKGYRLLRAAPPVEDLDPASGDLDMQTEIAVDWALGLLEAAGLTEAMSSTGH